MALRVEHQLEQLLLAGDVAIERHRGEAEFLGDSDVLAQEEKPNVVFILADDAWLRRTSDPTAVAGRADGRVLMVKVALFLMMLEILATVNRLQLSPRLEVDGTTRKLERNSLIEAGLGVFVLLIVGALGTLPPAIHDCAGHMH